MLPIQKKFSTTNVHINQNNINYIIVHETDNESKGANALAHRNAQHNGNLPEKASVHYYVDDKNIIQVVEHQHGTNNCGDGYNKYGINNRNTISIEICVNSDGNYDYARSNTIELVAYLKKQYPNATVVRHYDASRKNCPSRIQNSGYWPTFLKRVDEILNIKGEGDSTSTTPQGGTYMSKVYKNGSTPEPVYSDSTLKNKIGSLDPYEKCTCIAEINGKAIVLYKINGTSNYKSGFVKYVGGIQK